MGTRKPTGKGKPGKIKSVDEVYKVVDHQLKPYQPKLINAAAISDKIIRRRMGVNPKTPSPKQGKTYIKKPTPKK
tara:strand:- start:776 stop:1000 length:225 start_codon:yes stop_codon:yes gene_type:complete